MSDLLMYLRVLALAITFGCFVAGATGDEGANGTTSFVRSYTCYIALSCYLYQLDTQLWLVFQLQVSQVSAAHPIPVSSAQVDSIA